jgi:hypothetical protein
MSMQRAIRRNIAKRQGTFVAKKLYKERPDNSKKTMLARIAGLFRNKKQIAEQSV